MTVFLPWTLINVAVLAAMWIVFASLSAIKARRLRRRKPSNPAELVNMLPASRHVLVTGATGFIGRRLVEALTSAGHRVTVLTRDPSRAAILRPPFQLVASLDQIPGDARIDAVINLAGDPIAGGLWTRRRRRRILSSRLRVTRATVRLIARLEQKPQLLISGSAVGWYGLWGDETLTEFDGGKRCFTHRVCEAWEQAAKKAQRFGVRVVRLRTGMVLGTDGGIVGRLLIPFELGLGGPLGSGRQWMSWIERDDLVRLIAHVMATPALTGAVNGTAPAPATNAEFTAELGRVLRRPAVIRIPAFLLRRLGGALADELLLGGQRVIPDKAAASGFVFRHDTIGSALDAIIVGDGKPRAPQNAPAKTESAAPKQRIEQPIVESAAGLLRSLRLPTR